MHRDVEQARELCASFVVHGTTASFQRAVSRRTGGPALFSNEH